MEATRRKYKVRSEAQQKKLEDLSHGPDIPEDVQYCWFEIARRAQSACAGNNGYGIMNITVVVNKGKAVMWLPPDIEKIEPSRLVDEIELSSETISSLAFLASRNGNKL